MLRLEPKPRTSLQIKVRSEPRLNLRVSKIVSVGLKRPGGAKQSMANSTITTQCCIAGGGPAGMMLGFLLARAGVHVVVLEKHADFFRDFRGDTVHPSTLEVMVELGLIDKFLQLPHQKVETLSAPKLAPNTSKWWIFAICRRTANSSR